MHSTLSSHGLTAKRSCILVLMLIGLLTGCATQTAGHLPKQGIYTHARLSFQMQYALILAEQILTETGIKLQVRTEILTKNLPPWATQLEAGNLDIYLVDAENVVVATQSHALPPQNLSDTTHIQLTTEIPLEKDLLSAPLFLAFGYRLPLTDTQKTQRLLLTETAATN